STLQEKGIPSMVQRTLIRPPSARMGPLTPAARKKVMGRSPGAGRYDQAVDRESAYELPQKKAVEAAKTAEQEERQAEKEAASEGGSGWTLPDFGGSDSGKAPRKTSRRSGYRRQTVTETAIKSVVRTIGSTLGRELVRGILGSLRRR